MEQETKHITGRQSHKRGYQCGRVWTVVNPRREGKEGRKEERAQVVVSDEIGYYL